MVLGVENGADLASMLLRDEVFIPSLIFAGVVLIVGIKALASVLKTNARERSRREIAAYIAEGSMSAEQGERLMKAVPRDE